MKSKEEIEQLAKQLCNIPIDLVIDEEERYYKNFQKYDGIIQGYTQCQEDMIDKKYTELQLRFFADELIKGIEEKNKQGYEDIKVDYESLILSLNKQD